MKPKDLNENVYNALCEAIENTAMYDKYADGPANEFTERTLIECLVEGDEVWRSESSDHRWISYFDKVVQIGHKYFSFVWATAHGDASIYDQGFEFDWSTVEEVEPKAVKVIQYVPVRYN